VGCEVAGHNLGLAGSETPESDPSDEGKMVDVTALRCRAIEPNRQSPPAEKPPQKILNQSSAGASLFMVYPRRETPSAFLIP